MNAQLSAGSATTNEVVNLAVTNLPGRIQINASRELNLALAQISRPNYMSLQSTNQFDGSPGASIQVPYSDLNLGVTNGFLTISNLLTPQPARLERHLPGLEHAMDYHGHQLGGNQCHYRHQ